MAINADAAKRNAKKKVKTEVGDSISKVYKFTHATPTVALRPYLTTLYTGNLHEVHNLLGVCLFNAGKDTLKSFEVNPAGFNFIVVDRDKKGRSEAGLYRTDNMDSRTAKFDTKKYGMPRSAAYTQDARGIVVATDKAVYMCDPRKLVPTLRLATLPFVPESMLVSPNGYYLAAVSGDSCVIVNLENNTVRATLQPGDRISDMAFSPDNSDFSLLTADGILTVYGTRTFDMRKMIDDLGDGLAMAYNFDGKYVAVAKDNTTVSVVNMLNDSDREEYNPGNASMTDVAFIADAGGNTLLTAADGLNVEARRLIHLKPYYNRLINDETDARMAEWLKMMPGETMEEYRARVNDESRARQRMKFEYEVSTRLAGNLLAGAAATLGSYDRANGVLAVSFGSMPTIFLPVPENEVTEFRSGADVCLDEVYYGVNPDDSFEIVYAKITNSNNGKSYVYDNTQRKQMDYMAADDAISLEVLQQQQMEELKLQELRAKVVEEAKSRNVISDNTNITVDSRIVPDYNADGKKILNYVVSFTYDVAPGFSAVEDFGPGKYHVEESGAATSMLNIVRSAFEGDLDQYLKAGKTLRVSLTGTADATPIVHGIAYDGACGDFDNEPVYVNGQLSSISVDSKTPVKQNEQLAFLRAMGVKDYLEKNVKKYDDMKKNYRYEVNVSEDKGSEFRRITAEFTFVDAF